MEKTETFGLGSSYFISVSALLYLGSRIHWHYFFKNKRQERNKTYHHHQGYWKSKEKSILTLALQVEANLWVQRTNARNWHCLAMISKAPRKWVEMPS